MGQLWLHAPCPLAPGSCLGAAVGLYYTTGALHQAPADGPPVPSFPL